MINESRMNEIIKRVIDEAVVSQFTPYTEDEKEKLKKQKEYNDIYRRRFYKVYANDVNMPSVYHGELYNSITKGFPIDFEKLRGNLDKKVFDKEKIENPGNVIVSQTLDGTIFNYSDEEIKSKMLS